MKTIFRMGTISLFLMALGCTPQQEDPEAVSDATVPVERDLSVATREVESSGLEGLVLERLEGAEQGVRVPAGWTLTLALTDALSTERNQAGDEFTARLVDAVTMDEETVIPAGSTAYGRIVTVEPSAYGPRIEMLLTRLEAGGRSYDLETNQFGRVSVGPQDSALELAAEDTMDITLAAAVTIVP